MKVKSNSNSSIIEIQTEVYQARNGGFYMNWGRGVIALSKEEAEIVVWDMPEFDHDKYNEFYKTKPLNNSRQ